MTMNNSSRITLNVRFGKLSKDRFIFFLLICIYKAVIEFVYLYRISPLFSYSLLTTNINSSKMIYSWFLCVITCMIHPMNKKRPSSFLFLLMTLVIWIPLISYYWMNNQSTAYVSFEMLCILIVAIWCHISPRKFMVGKSISHTFFDALFVVYVVVTLFLIIKRGGIDPRAFDFKNVYKIRSEYDNLGKLDGYLVNWSAKALFPMMSSYMFLRKKRLAMIVSFCLQAGLYLSYGYKAFLASVFLLILIYALIAKRNSIKNIIATFTIGNVAAYYLDILGISDILRGFLPYRTLFIPAKNQFHYYEFFTNHDFLNLSGSFLGRLIASEYKYDRPIGFVVEAYFISSGSNGNTGVFSYGFADFGFIGMLVVAIIVGFLFWFVDGITYNIPIPLTVGTLSYWVITMNDNSLLITMVTGGFLLLLFLLMLMNTSDLFAKRIETEK